MIVRSYILRFWIKAMTVQPPAENITFYDEVDDDPTWREGYDEYEKRRVVASIGKVFRDAEDLTERMIREHAYQLWDRAGRPEGRSEEFWSAANAVFERHAVEQLARFRRHQLTRAFGDVSEAMDAGT
jgi:hypothetical protein